MATNKFERNLEKRKHYFRRLKNLGLKEGQGNFYAFKSHGKPCSCFLCSPYKYQRNKKENKDWHVLTHEEIEAGRCHAYQPIF